ncbi:MAG: hypothetical protein J5I93_02515, partial [Pirellulaceae bacterium]|nr:hypothetical protein [Pirellulaceae bacterium]
PCTLVVCAWVVGKLHTVRILCSSDLEPAEGPIVPPADEPGARAIGPQPAPPVVPNGPEVAPVGEEPGAGRPVPPSEAGPEVRPAARVEPGDASARPPVGTPLPGEPAVLPPAGLPGEPAFPPPGLIAGVPERPGPPPVAAQAPGVDVAHLISDSQLLLRYQAENESWLRVPPNGAIFAGEYLSVLPTFRPQVLLASGIKATLSGPATATVEATEGSGGIRIRLLEGRLLLMTVGKLGAQMPLDLAGRRGLVTFHDVDSALAVDVRRVLPPGADPEANGAWLEARLYASSGRLSWQEGGRQDAAPELALSPGQVAVLQADRAVAVETVSGLPAWIDPRTSLSAMDRKTSETIEPLIETNRSVRLALMELCEHRQLDVRSLAARCLAYLGDYGPLVDQLSDERQKAYWDKAFESLRAGIVRGPADAAQLRQALAGKVPERAAILYRLLWGFHPDQLQAGEAAKLVDYLEHPEMDVRVVAFQNLKWITGGVTLLYRPEAQVSDERSKLLRWRERLEAGEIRWEGTN